MLIARLPAQEAERLARLRRFGVLDTLPQESFDHITTLASAICGTPMALVSLVDEDRQWFKSKIGLSASETPREMAFCAHAILDPDHVMVVENAHQDERFRDNPLVTGDPRVCFYAGAPIVTRDGLPMGTVCVIDHQPRKLDAQQEQSLRSLASLVLSLMEREEAHQFNLHTQQQESVRQAEMQASLAAAGLDLLSYVDSDYTYRYVNNCYLQYWGRQLEDIVGQRIPELMGEDTFSRLVKPHFDTALSGQEVSYEAVIAFPGVGERAVEVTYLPAFRPDGSVKGVVVRSHDVQGIHTRELDLKATVEQLEHKTLEQQRFIHIISHDLREPINTICNFSGLLAEDETLNLPPHASKYLGYVQSGGNRIKCLLDDLLEFLHLDRHDLDLAPVNMNTVAANVCEDLSSRIAERKAQVDVAALPAVMGDATLLRILVQNLVANALKFCPSDRTPMISIEGCEEDGWHLIRVQDNGIGIPPEHRKKIFEMFTRLHNKKDVPGTGLGLSICRRIADLHRGQIQVGSDQMQGSCFELKLPVAHAS
ncbi:ATP-binding protein [Hydrogenophaga sp. 5NK40-0174]|uniref:GAF domain-containing sensor histidine kinase n=1 Tax=Hydrogenophaga sp. 5NK40-0174 TaxID=3127649 RepID=UPI00310798E1